MTKLEKNNMNTKFCLPVIKTSIAEVKKTIDQYPDYDMYEIWVDYLDNLSLTSLMREDPSIPSLGSVLQAIGSEAQVIDSEVAQTRGARRDDRCLIICFRRKNGELLQMPFEKRKKIIDNSIRKNILIDCDIEYQKKDLKYIKSKNQESEAPKKEIKFIASYHNYKKTPDDNELNKIITSMQKYNPEIYKIATFCQNYEDSVRLMQLLVQLNKQNKKAIILGMGDHGKITRVFGALYGNEIAFTPENGEVSAPGQMTREKLRLMIKDL